jgi:hypothetical protein
MALSADQVVQVLLTAAQRMGVTLTPQELVGLTAIAGRESGYNPQAYNGNTGTGDNSYGLWQINMLGSMGPARAAQLGITNYNQLFDPVTNAMAAINLVLSGRQSGDPLRAWGGYKGMSDTYNTNVPAAQAAVQRVTGGQGGTATLMSDLQPTGTTGITVPPFTYTPQTVAVDPASLTPYTQNAQPGWGPPSATTVPGTVYLDQNQYVYNREGALNFIKDWITLGGRGIIGGDGQPASYWDVYNDLQQHGVDVSGLPTPESMPQGMVKGGGAQSPLRDTPPSAAQMQAQQDMTSLLGRLGVDYANAPRATPALVAYLRGVGLSLSTAEDARNAAVSRIQAQTPLQISNIQRAADQERQNLTGNLEQRGVLSSGEANTRYANQAGATGQKISQVNQAAAQGIGTAQTAYAQSADQLRQQALEKVLQAETDEATQRATSQAQASAYQQQQEAQAKAWNDQMAAQKAYYDQLANQYATGGPDSYTAPPSGSGAVPVGAVT